MKKGRIAGDDIRVLRQRIAELEAQLGLENSANSASVETVKSYQRVVEMSPDAVFIHVGGKVVFANPAMVRLMGAESADQLIGMTALDIMHPDLHDRIMQIRDDIARTNQAIDLEDLRFMALDGNVIDVEAAAAPIQWNGKNAFSVVARDVTERKLAEWRQLAA